MKRILAGALALLAAVAAADEGPRKLSTSTYHVIFCMKDSTDHVTGKTGLSPTVTLSKNGGSFGSASGSVTEIANGCYKLAGNTTDTNTLGLVVGYATATGADPVWFGFTVVTNDPFTVPDTSSTIAAVTTVTTTTTATTCTNVTNAPTAGDFTSTMKTSLNNSTPACSSVSGAVGSVTGNVGGNVVGTVASVVGNVGGNVAGSVGSVTGAVGSVTGNVGGNVTGSVGSVATGGITAASIAADAIGASELAADAVTEIQSGLATSSNVAGVQSDTDDIQSRLPAALAGGRMDSSVGAYQTGLAPLQPTTAGRTLDVTATGEAGIDWANIGSPTTTVNLSGTTIGTVTTYTGNTPQTGDAYARLGAPAGASVSEDIAAIYGRTDVATSSRATPDEARDAVWTKFATGPYVVTDSSPLAGSFTTNLPSTTTGWYAYTAIRFTSGGLAGVTRVVRFYIGATHTVVLESDFPTAPLHNDQFDLLYGESWSPATVAGAMWNEPATDHLNSGSTGEALFYAPSRVWDEATTDHTNDGTFGAFVQALTSGSLTPADIWRYASRTLTAVTSGATIISPTGTAGTLRLTRGDDYTLTSGPAISISRDAWMDLSTATEIRLTVRTRPLKDIGADPVLFSITDTLSSRQTGTGTQVVVFEPTHTDTSALVPGVNTAKYDVQATFPGNEVRTLETGLVTVIEDQSR